MSVFRFTTAVKSVPFGVALMLSGCGIFYPEPITVLDVVENESVVLIHGLGRGASNMRQLKTRMQVQGYTVCSIDYSTIGQSVEKMVAETSSKIDACVNTSGKVNFVGHSLGGLVIRSYLAEHVEIEKDHQLGRVVTLGTPHHGSEVADSFDDGPLIKIAGGVSQSLVTGERSLGNQLPLPNYDIGAIAGTNSNMTTEHYFDGINDGLVSLESAKIAGMQDFIALDVTHINMPYDPEVAYQTLYFLQTGQFDHLSINSHYDH